MDSVILSPRRRAAGVDGGFEVTSARDLVKQRWNAIDVSSVARDLRIQRRALVVIGGPPGAGKSTLALRLLCAPGTPAVLLSAEERLGASVGERLERLGIHRADLHVVGRGSVDALVDFIREKRCRLLCVDSVQATSLLPSDLRGLINALDLDALIAVSQVTKTGDLRGTHQLRHEADVVIEVVDGGQWNVTKSRFAATGVAGETFK